MCVANCTLWLPMSSPTMRERERERLSFIQHKSPKITCSLQVTFFNWFDIGISFKDPELLYTRSFEMHWQQTYRESSFYVAFMRGTLVYDKSPHSLSHLQYVLYRCNKVERTNTYILNMNSHLRRKFQNR